MSDFHERFGIKIDRDKVRKRFVARAFNEIFDKWDELPSAYRRTAIRPILSYLGERHEDNYNWIQYYIQKKSFEDLLDTIEAIYEVDINYRNLIAEKVIQILDLSEIDIGIRWQDGKFWPKGAELLDEQLVNDPLKWLRQNRHSTVIDPFEKALRHFLEAESRPEVRSDVITDAYEALEALAKIVLDNDRDLSQNREKFVSKIKGKVFHKEILRQYVKYGCKYRHAADPESPRPQPTIAEAEFFLYFTGSVLRLAMENWDGS